MFLDGTRFCGSGFGKTKLNDYFCLDIMPTQRCGRKKINIAFTIIRVKPRASETLFWYNKHE